MSKSTSNSCSNMNLLFWNTLLFLISFSERSVHAYKNYTVGDSLGWFDTLEKPDVNYKKWVAGKNFSLGDFLIFNSDTNHSVIQTYNFTTYKLCDFDNDQNNDTTEWSTIDPSASSPNAVSVAVPLLKVGVTYFFSSDYDGEQCKNGQNFKINVTYGQGLPKSLLDPSEEAPAPNNPDSGDDQPTPDTLVPSSFNHPQDVSDDDETSDSVSLAMFSKLHGKHSHGILIAFGFIFTIYHV